MSVEGSEKSSLSVCFICEKRDRINRKLIICDSAECKRVTHLKCSGLKREPKGKWFCMMCVPASAEQANKLDDSPELHKAESVGSEVQENENSKSFHELLQGGIVQRMSESEQ